MAIVVSNENELINALEWQDADALANIRFSDWLSLELAIRGDGYEGGIPPRIMPAFIQIQRTIDRMYLRSLGRAPGTGRRLSTQERRQVAISVLMDAVASTRFSIDLTQPLNNALTAAVESMAGEELVIAILGLGLIWGVSHTAISVWKAHLDRKIADRRIDYDILVRDTEQRYLDIIWELQEKCIPLRSVMDDIHKVQDMFLQNMEEKDELSIGGERIVNGRMARQLTKSPKASRTPTRLRRVYDILSVDSGNVSRGVRIQVRDVESRRRFKVTALSLSAEDISILQDAEWNKTPLSMELDTEQVEDRIIKATLVSVETYHR